MSSYRNRYRLAEQFVTNRTYEKYFLNKSVDKNICVFGAGALGKETAQWLINKASVSRIVFSDNNPSLWGSKIYGIPIFDPKTVLDNIGDYFIFVAVADKGVKYNRMINKQFTACKSIMRNPLGLTAYWLQTFELDGGGRELFDRAINCFADDYSRKLYRLLWEFRLQSEVIDYPSDILDNFFYSKQYIVPELVDYKRLKVCLDIGAFDGDSLCDLIENTSEDCFYFCFEFDNNIFAKLKRRIEVDFVTCQSRIVAYPYGVSDSCKRVCYITDEIGGSKICDSSDLIARVVNLDSMNFGRRVDFIKMDIEGEEENALKGALETIKRDRPVLAISIYHNLSQYLSIPLMIKSIDDNYKLYLRHHKYTLDDTVLYAVYDGTHKG